MAVGTVASVARQQFSDSNGDPLAGGFLYSYLSGTTTPDPLFTDGDLLVPHTNPLVLDAGGFATIFQGSGSQKWILTDALGVVQWTVDPVTSAATSAGGGGAFGEEYVFEGNSAAAIANTTYPVGATGDKLHPGTAILSVDSAGIVGTYKLEVTGMLTAAGTLTVGIFDLSSGSPDTPLATATITSLTGEVKQSGTIAFGLPGVVRLYGIKALVSANVGFAWGIKLIKVPDAVVVPPPADTGYEEIFNFGTNSAAEVSNTTFPSGATFDKLHPGSRPFQKDSVSLSSGTYLLQITGMMASPGTLTVGIFDLSSGFPDVPLATAALTSTTGQVVVSGTITWGAVGTVKTYGLKSLVSGGSGFVIGAVLVKVIP